MFNCFCKWSEVSLVPFLWVISHVLTLLGGREGHTRWRRTTPCTFNATQELPGSQTAIPDQLCTTLGHTEQRREAAALLCPPGLQEGLNIQDEDISSRGRRGALTPPTAPAHPTGGAAAAGRPRAREAVHVAKDQHWTLKTSR